MTNEEIFDKCAEIYKLPNDDKKTTELYPLLQELKEKNIKEYPAVLNHLIRELGLYPYMSGEQIIFEDRLARECFTEDVGEQEPCVLHREQARILHKLLEGKNLAVSAPTSFGKSFIIDALIAIKKPRNILIIVPTLSLMDEMRRRIARKFGDKYHIITQTEESMENNKNNILILPAERAIHFLNTLAIVGLDLCIIDEFYKITTDIYSVDKRVHILQSVAYELKKIAKQFYFLCPSVSQISDKHCHNVFLRDIEKLSIKIKTVALNLTKLDSNKKQKELYNVLEKHKNEKTLIYFGQKKTLKTYYKKIGIFFASNKLHLSQKLELFSKWISHYYGSDWDFPTYIKYGIGQHHADLHRFLQQMQIDLFDKNNHFTTLLTTTSLIEGVNTSAKNVIIWDNQVADNPMSFVTYHNIIGRCGRMFRYFVGNVYFYEKVFDSTTSEILEIIPSEDFLYRKELDKKDKHEDAENIIKKLYGYENLQKIKTKIANHEISMTIQDISELLSCDYFEKMVDLLNTNENFFDYKIFDYPIVEQKFTNKKSHLSNKKMLYIFKDNYKTSIFDIANKLNIKIYTYFSLEKKIIYDYSTFFNDLNILQKIIFPRKEIDFSFYITKMSHAFLPKNVFYLEEWGLPRMISKKIHQAGIINLEDDNIPFENIIKKFKTEVDKDFLINKLKEEGSFFEFDDEFIEYFYEGLGR